MSSVACTVEFTTESQWGVSNPEAAAKADFTVTPGTIRISLTNLFARPLNITQGLSGISFALADGRTTGLKLRSSSSQEIDIARDGQYGINGIVTTGWMMRASGTTVELYFGGSGKKASHILLGTGPYTGANPSITGNSGHNPFLREVATFELAAPLVSAATRISSMVFLFGSNYAAYTGEDLTPNPEPGSMLLMGGGLAAILLLSSKYARKVGAAGRVGGAAGRGPGRYRAAAPAAGEPAGKAG